MKKNKEKKQKRAEQARYDRGQVFVKIVAGILALMMIVAVAASAMYVLFR